MYKSPLDVHKLVVDDAYSILVSLNISPVLGQLDAVVKADTGLSEVINSLLQVG